MPQSTADDNHDSRVLVDWLSFTIATPKAARLSERYQQIAGILEEQPQLLWLLQRSNNGSPFAGLSMRKGRFPYSNRLSNQNDSLSIFYGTKTDHILIEVTGQGCASLGYKRTHDIIASHCERITRIDIAVDVECGTRPVEVLEVLPAGRWRSTGHIVSDTGETLYLGSSKSDRYARVYRYDKPHPRADYLRYEMVFKKENARIIAQALLQSPIEIVAADAGNAFNFNHPSWLYRSDNTIKAYRPERNKEKTRLWIYSQVIPALRKSFLAGVITEQEFYEALHQEGEDESAFEGE